MTLGRNLGLYFPSYRKGMGTTAHALSHKGTVGYQSKRKEEFCVSFGAITWDFLMGSFPLA